MPKAKKPRKRAVRSKEQRPAVESWPSVSLPLEGKGRVTRIAHWTCSASGYLLPGTFLGPVSGAGSLFEPVEDENAAYSAVALDEIPEDASVRDSLGQALRSRGVETGLFSRIRMTAGTRTAIGIPRLERVADLADLTADLVKLARSRPMDRRLGLLAPGEEPPATPGQGQIGRWFTRCADAGRLPGEVTHPLTLFGRVLIVWTRLRESALRLLAEAPNGADLRQLTAAVACDVVPLFWTDAQLDGLRGTRPELMRWGVSSADFPQRSEPNRRLSPVEEALLDSLRGRALDSVELAGPKYLTSTPATVRNAVRNIRLKCGDSVIQNLPDKRYYRPDCPPPDLADLLRSVQPRKRRRRIQP